MKTTREIINQTPKFDINDTKEKLDYQEQKAFESALKEMASDLSDGGINPGLYHYLFPHLSGLSEIEYKTKYHNILEYLLKVMKNNIAEKLTEKD